MTGVFLIDVSGEFFTPEQMKIVWRDEVRAAHGVLDALIAETWARQSEVSRVRGTTLFNGRLARYLRHRVDSGIVTIEVGPTDYAAFIGTNYLHHARADEFGWELFSNPVGTSATLITADGWLVFGRRNERVACLPGYVHNFGGGLEADEKRPDGTFDGFASIRRELDEELGLKAGDIEQLVCLGLIRDAQIRQPELIFDAQVRLTRADLASRIGSDDHEHAAIAACRDEPNAILPFLGNTERIAPVTVGSICLHGRRRFGPVWYDSTRKLMAGVP